MAPLTKPPGADGTTTRDAPRASALPRTFEEALAALAAGPDLSDPRLLHRLRRLLHPDASGDPRATAAFVQLNERTTTHPRTISSRKATYVLTGEVLKGSVADLFATRCSHLVKVVRSAANSDLLDRESTALTTLKATDQAAYFPEVVDSFTQPDRRRALVLKRLEGFVTLEEVARAHGDALDARDAAWIWRRLLVALGAAHRAGLVHANVLPEHVMVHPTEHGLVLLDWSMSTTTGQGAVAVVPGREAFYPAQIRAGSALDASTDLFMATRTMERIIGAMPRQLKLFAASTQLDSALRPRDAWALLADLDAVLADLWGRRRYRPLHMPPSSSSA